MSKIPAHSNCYARVQTKPTSQVKPREVVQHTATDFLSTKHESGDQTLISLGSYQPGTRQVTAATGVDLVHFSTPWAHTQLSAYVMQAPSDTTKNWQTAYYTHKKLLTACHTE